MLDLITNIFMRLNSSLLIEFNLSVVYTQIYASDASTVRPHLKAHETINNPTSSQEHHFVVI